ncbi:MAG: CoA pyrophosphatase [Arcanobacterium sp.]|nr:CoA pyrophosphatase [Arcanobacterium sp.]
MHEDQTHLLSMLGVASERWSHIFSALPTRSTWRRGQAHTRHAAVMALISPADAPSILFTQRAQGIPQGGQVSFPGGGREEGENDPRITALRETREEIGLPPSEIEVVGALPGHARTRLHYDVVAFVGLWNGQIDSLVPNAQEVGRVFSVPVSELIHERNRVTWEIDGGHRGPGFWVDDVLIWGMTAGITNALLEIFGWSEPWDHSRIVPVPPEFR